MKLWKRILALNLSVGIAAGLLIVALNRTDRAHILTRLAYSLATAFFVATPIVWLFSRLGMRMYRLRVPLNWAVIGVSILTCTAAGNLLLGLCYLGLGLVAPHDFWSVFWARVQGSAVVAAIVSIGAIGYHILHSELEATTLELQSRQLEQERASKLAVEAQLASLESHIRPHFLFNTLNAISALIPEDPKMAESLVGKLATLLRLSLDSNQERVGSLERELRIVNDYLEIERARYGDRLRYQIHIPPELHFAEIPTLAVQTLVENSVKHAVASRFQGAEIRLAAYACGESMFVEVSDDGPGFTAASIRSGHGLDNLQRRLAALFGSEGTLEISKTGDFTAVSLRLPLIRRRYA